MKCDINCISFLKLHYRCKNANLICVTLSLCYNMRRAKAKCFIFFLIYQKKGKTYFLLKNSFQKFL